MPLGNPALIYTNPRLTYLLLRTYLSPTLILWENLLGRGSILVGGEGKVLPF